MERSEFNDERRLVLGVDPGLQNTGLGLISIDTFGVPSYVHHTIIQTKSSHSLENRLNRLFTELTDFIQQFKPSVMIVEEIFASINSNTIIKLGMARAIPVLCASRHNCTLFNVTTRLVKKKITGKGNAEKEEVARAVCRILKIPLISDVDATDALACALYMM